MQPPPQLTPKAIVLGALLAMLLAAANAYLGLFAGLTVSASIPAAVISMGVLKLFRDSNILENNIVQTSASAGESVAAGAIFTLPALILLGYWDFFDYAWVCLLTGIGGLLGVLFTVPLRRSLIVEQSLPFPEGTATAEVLKAGDRPGRGLRLLGLAGLAGAAIKFAESGLRLWPPIAHAGAVTGQQTVWYFGTNVSPALVSVGYIVGLNVAALVFAGGVISWLVAIPLYTTWVAPESVIADPTEYAFAIWSSRIRYLGVGAMLVGGVWTLVSLRGSVLGALRTRRQTGPSAAGVIDHTEQDTPMAWVLIGTAVFVVPMFAVYSQVLQNFGTGLVLTAVMLVAGFLFSGVAGYMAGLVGSSNNPISGITIATILFSSLLLLIMTGTGEDAAAAAILIGAVVCCAAAIAGDNMQDLKAGYLLGATPWKQQLMQGVGVISAVLVMAPVLNLLLNAYGIGPATESQPNALTAPQATLMASVASGVLGGDLPWSLIGMGAVLGSAVIALDEYLKRRHARFRAPVLAVAVGVYLPLELSVPIFVGGLVSAVVRKYREVPGGDPGILVAAGLITGEALVGILIAIPIVTSGNPDVLAIGGAGLGPLAGLATLTLVVFGLWRSARTQSTG